MLVDGTGQIFADFARRVLFLPAFWEKLPAERASALHASFLRLLLTSAESAQYLACLTAGPWGQSQRLAENRGEIRSVLGACAQREPVWEFRESVYTAVSESVLQSGSLRFAECGSGADLMRREMLGFLEAAWDGSFAKDGAEHRVGALGLVILDRLGQGEGEGEGAADSVGKRRGAEGQKRQGLRLLRWVAGLVQAVRSGKKRGDAVPSDLVYNAMYRVLERFDDAKYGDAAQRAALETIPRNRSRGSFQAPASLNPAGLVGPAGPMSPAGLAGSMNPMSSMGLIGPVRRRGSNGSTGSTGSNVPLALRSSGIYASFDGSLLSPPAQKEEEVFGESALDEYAALAELLERWLKGKYYEEPDADGNLLTGAVLYTHPKLLPLLIHAFRYVCVCCEGR